MRLYRPSARAPSLLATSLAKIEGQDEKFYRVLGGNLVWRLNCGRSYDGMPTSGARD
jgi:hypothetical protein